MLNRRSRKASQRTLDLSDISPGLPNFLKFRRYTLSFSRAQVASGEVPPPIQRTQAKSIGSCRSEDQAGAGGRGTR